VERHPSDVVAFVVFEGSAALLTPQAFRVSPKRVKGL
jgi:hypothetical protein